MYKYIVVDIETTGHIAEEDAQIIDIGIVVIKDNDIIQEYTTLLKPNKPIPAFISHLTGITDEDVVDAPTFPEIAQDIRAFFQNGYLVAHNVPFRSEERRVGKECRSQWARQQGSKKQ